jgi:hypothetical protein
MGIYGASRKSSRFLLHTFARGFAQRVRRFLRRFLSPCSSPVFAPRRSPVHSRHRSSGCSASRRRAGRVQASRGRRARGIAGTGRFPGWPGGCGTAWARISVRPVDDSHKPTWGPIGTWPFIDLMSWGWGGNPVRRPGTAGGLGAQTPGSSIPDRPASQFEKSMGHRQIIQGLDSARLLGSSRYFL